MEAVKAVEKVQKATEGMKIVKTILVKNRLVNLIVKPQWDLAPGADWEPAVKLAKLCNS